MIYLVAFTNSRRTTLVILVFWFLWLSIILCSFFVVLFCWSIILFLLWGFRVIYMKYEWKKRIIWSLKSSCKTKDWLNCLIRSIHGYVHKECIYLGHFMGYLIEDFFYSLKPIGKGIARETICYYMFSTIYTFLVYFPLLKIASLFHLKGEDPEVEVR